MTEIVFYALAAMALGGAIGVVLQRSPVASLLSMVGTLASVAGIFVLLEAHFLAAIQVMVYAGAIMVLFLFVIMLLNLGHDYEPDLRRGVGQFLAFGIVGTIAGFLARQLRGSGGQPGLPVFSGPGGDGPPARRGGHRRSHRETTLHRLRDRVRTRRAPPPRGARGRGRAGEEEGLTPCSPNRSFSAHSFS